MQKRKRSSSKKKDDGPKKPLNAWFTWRADNIDAFRAKNPDIDNKELGQLLSAAWKSVDKAVKESYQQAYKERMVTWQAERAEWTAQQEAKNGKAIKLEEGGVASTSTAPVTTAAASSSVTVKAEKNGDAEQTGDTAKKADANNDNEDDGLYRVCVCVSMRKTLC